MMWLVSAVFYFFFVEYFHDDGQKRLKYVGGLLYDGTFLYPTLAGINVVLS